jgi:hypothetical protein
MPKPIGGDGSQVRAPSRARGIFPTYPAFAKIVNPFINVIYHFQYYK